MKQDKIRFIVYSDIHYDKLAARCITLDDCLKIEENIMRRVEIDNFDFTLFCGDRFLKRDPEDEVKTKADKLLSEWVKYNNKPHFNLIGNHDWVTNSMKWHTSKSLEYSVADGLIINMDYLSVYDCAHLPIKIFAVPSGSDVSTLGQMIVYKDFLNIMVFHDIVSGSYADDDEKQVFGSGVDINLLDKECFDVVFGGDIHVPQMLPFNNTMGGYVGSVMQRTRADANKARGWLEVESVFDGKKWNTECQFMESRGFFVRYDIEVGKDDTFESITNKIDEDEIYNKFIEFKFTGLKVDIDNILNDGRWNNLVNLLNVRGIDFVRMYGVENKDVVVDMSNSDTVMDDLNLYIDSGFVNIGNISKQSLMDTLGNVISEES